MTDIAHMSDLYYTQRIRIAIQPPDPQIGEDFWLAFCTYIDRLTSANYLCRAFPVRCDDYSNSYGRDDDAIAARLTEGLGRIQWPIPPDQPPQSERVLDILEFFFSHVAKPKACWRCGLCGNIHQQGYDLGNGRKEYTAEINKMLARFNHPYRLQKGQVVRIGCELIDDRIAQVDFVTPDSHLLHLLNCAKEDFYDRSGTRKLDGLRNVVEAFERLKTIENRDKKKGAEMLVHKLSPDIEIRSHFDEHLRRLTEFHNKYTIRHNETDKITLTDEGLVDYLFYSYYNLVILIMDKYKLIGPPH